MARTARNLSTLKQFHGTGEDPYPVGNIQVPVLEAGDVMAKQGEILLIAYRSDRKNQDITYVHGFANNVFEGNQKLLDCLDEIQRTAKKAPTGPDLLVFPDGQTYLFRAQFTDRGIEE